MMKRLSTISKEKYWDYFILVARFLLGWTFLRYGYGKLTNGQFGVSELELLTPIKDISLFRLSWYLFDHEPFKSFVGISQIICGALLIINRTAIIGAFVFIPIVTTILIIDLTFMSSGMAASFVWRLSFYITLDLLILWHYKEKMQMIWISVWHNVTTRFKYSILAYLILPLLAVGLDIAGNLPKIVSNWIMRPTEMRGALEEIPALVSEVIKYVIR